MSDGDIVYDPQALQQYEEAHAVIQKAGTLAEEISEAFQALPQAFDASVVSSMQAHHQIIQSKFEDAHHQLTKLLSETAPGEIHDMFGLDQRLSG